MKNIISLIIVLLAFTSVNAQKDSLEINESLTQVFYRGKQLQTSLSVTNDGKKIDAKIQLDVLGVDGSVLGRTHANQMIERGGNFLKFDIPFEFPKLSTETLWTRLRYTVSTASSNITGIISLSEIMPELFKIRASGSESVFAGMNYVVRVRTIHPIKSYPIANVKLDAELVIDDAAIDEDGDPDNLEIKASGVTDKNGYATLQFQIPANLKFNYNTYDDAEIKINGDKNGLKVSARDSIEALTDETSVYLNTDKPLYQPNQKISIRGLVLERIFGNTKRKAVADKDLEFKISDEENTVLYRETVKTSRFGVASIEWQIPDNAKLGRYKIKVSEEGEDALGYTNFKVSRYGLPNFIVKSKTDKDFYLPENKQAEVTIDATYLFGKDVAGGKVKIIRESDRRWNYKKQKFDVEEEETFEGETDKDGKFTQKIDLSKTHVELAGEDNDEKFEDLNFTAYFTDSTTNLTEQRRFDIRVSKEPIHIYLIGLENYDLNSKLPVELYVSTSTADGKPIETEVEIKGRYEYDDDKTFKKLTKAKTNSFGAAKISFKVPKCEENKCDEEDLELEITARDSEGKTGTLTNDDLDIDDDEKQIKIRTAKTIYKKGEPLKVEILSSEKETTAFIDVVRSGSSLSGHKVEIKNGRAKLTIPYQESFKSDLKILAYIDDDGSAVYNAKGIIYPTPKNLRFDVKTNKEIFRPAEDATLEFAVNSPDKTTGENALGVFILDKAVEERALTDSNFGGGFNTFGNFQGLLGNVKSFGGLTQNDIEELDLSKPISDDIELATEVMLYGRYPEPNFFSTYYYDQLQYVFREKLKEQFNPIKQRLNGNYRTNDYEHPTDVESFKQILSRGGINFDAMRDPWGNKYRVSVSIWRGENIINVYSDGADKRTGSEDDFTAVTLEFDYFTKIGKKIDKAVADHYEKTGEFVRDEATLRKALLAKDISLDNLKDRWGESYKIIFGAYQKNYTIEFKSGGSDKKISETYDSTDFVIWTNNTDYFAANQKKIEDILTKFISVNEKYPKDITEFKQVLKDGGVDFDSLRDGWGNPFYIESETIKRFTDRVKIETVSTFGEEEKQERYVVTPVTQEVIYFKIKSNGVNGKEETREWQKVRVATFAGVISEQTINDKKSKLVIPKTFLTNGNSVIFGVVTDQSKAVIPDVELILKNSQTNIVTKAEANDQGVYLIDKVPAGNYSLRVTSANFKTSVINDIVIARETITELNVSLEVGSVSTFVEVTADASLVNVSNGSLATNIDAQQIQDLPINGRNPLSLITLQTGVNGQRTSATNYTKDEITIIDDFIKVDGVEVDGVDEGNNDLSTSNTRKETPRLRNYFPETLLWNPEIVTDENGRATLKFKLADNITTWKIYAIASNLDGNIGVAEKEIKAFQPFFVDLLPPRMLTKGDEIYLPVQVRNYTDDTQQVNVEMAKADWFSFLNAETRTSANVQDSQTKKVEVAKNSTQNAVFGFRAENMVNEGFQKVTAIADRDSDAIEKPVTVKPDGKEVVQTASKLFSDSVTFDANFPANALPKTQQAEIKIYPNLFAHIAESVEGLLKRPYGCGEQTISSTYPNLMILKFAKEDNRLRPIAQKFLQKGYERLLGYQISSGGFSYWGGSDTANIALTAYAIRFLNDADEFIKVDADVVKNARNWLISQQGENGSWTQYYYGENKVENKRRTWQISTYVAKSLAMTESRTKEKHENVQKALGKVFEYLKKQNETIDEPYALANFGLALVDANKREEAKAIAEKLESMAIGEGKTVYWKLETNTPFYGWGIAGRVETTALVVELLTKVSRESAKGQSKTKDLISKGTMFLLKNKDRYGVWYSTQTTINVLNAFLATIGKDKDVDSSKERIAEIFVNGQKVKDMELPAADKLGFPLTIRVDSFLNPNNNKFEIKTNDEQTTMMAQVVQNHYISWSDFTGSNVDINQSRQIKLEYTCDKQKAKPTEEITCDVNAERVGFKGYGMLLAEIGIPPGADVDRASLEKVKDDDWSFSRYDVLPDRIIVYMWSRAGGTNFKFKFKPRYGINANTPASVVYDYYNSEANATVAPLRFEVE